jgi:N,N'-diacetyllegionaminate synthase
MCLPYDQKISNKVFIIAEAGVNHNGNLELAKKLVDVAVQAKADAVKFQSFRADKLVVRDAEKADYQKETTDAEETQYMMLKRLELSYEEHIELYNYCKTKNIMFLSTPFDFESVELLEDIGVEAYKIGSGDLTNMPLLRLVAQKHKPIILSTGMAGMDEVSDAVNWITREGNNQLVLLHCTTNYPASYHAVNLRAMQTLMSTFNLPTGYSDHTQGMEVSIAAVTMGAAVIEKHITLDKEMEGPDHKASFTPDEFKTFVQGIRNVEASLGKELKACTIEEENIRRIARKSIVALRDIAKGEKITYSNITVKRPENGLKPKFYDEIMGYEAAEDIKADAPIQWNLIRKE